MDMEEAMGYEVTYCQPDAITALDLRNVIDAYEGKVEDGDGEGSVGPLVVAKVRNIGPDGYIQSAPIGEALLCMGIERVGICWGGVSEWYDATSIEDALDTADAA